MATNNDPELKLKSKDENKYLLLVGNFGSGHEIIMRFLNKHFKKIKIVDRMNFPGNDFISQMDNLSKIYKMISNNNRFFRNQLFVCDNHPIFIQNCILPALHSLNKLTSREVIVFREWVRLIGMEKNHTTILYLKMNTNKCFERILNHEISLNTHENIIDYELLMEIQRQLTHWVENNNVVGNEHITIDMNKFLEIESDERYEKELIRYLLKELPSLEGLRK